MYLGTFIREVDGKGRFLVPAKLKTELDKTSGRGGEIILTVGFEHCLYLFPKAQWADFVKKEIESRSELSSDIRRLKRILAGKAQSVEIDKQGRLLVPKTFLDDYLKLPVKSKRIAVVGAMDHIEIWKESAWLAFEENMQEDFDDIAEKISRSGRAAV